MNGIASVLIICLVVSATVAGAASSEDAALDASFREHLEASFRLRPSTATGLGDHRFDDQLDDVSPAARARWAEQTRVTLEALPRRVTFSKLTRAGQIDYEILQHSLRRSLWLTEQFNPFVTDPRSYNGLISGTVFSLLTQSTLPLETNIANAVARIRQIPKVIAAARESLRNPPRVYVETAIQQNRGAIRFYETEVFELAGQTKHLATLKATAAELVPVLRAYQEFLEKDLLPRANGEWRIGREKFNRKFDLDTDAGVTAEQNYADAQAEFDRVRNEMYVIARQVWSRYCPGAILPPDDAEGRRETIERVLHRIAKDHGQPEQIVQDARATVAGIKRFIAAADILPLPEPDRCRIIEMPEFQRGNAVAYMASPPPLDPNATAHYAISPPPGSWDAVRVRSYLEEYNRHLLQVLTIHEAYPGHYVQMEHANRNPSPVRKVLGSGVFIEGWAVYTEQMMLDQGYGDGDPALRLSQLKFYLRAVANKILDHRMHCEAMTDDEAMSLLVKQAFQSEGEARLKVIRSKQSSVQLSTYFTGRMAHYRLRQQIQRELGDKFVLARYHEAVLANGSVPVKYLSELVRARLGLPQAATSEKP
ncbi:MAG: DUF885 domain-containing protein [Planctomycetota bacterium]|nr:DUF885 domain-containing protein [Planctomycetota bacterium]